MVKKALAGILLIALGFAIGGAYVKYSRRDGAQVSLQAPDSVVASKFRGARDFSEIVGAVSPSVVNISTVSTNKRARSYSDDPFYEFFNDYFTPYNDYGLQKKHKEQNQGSGLIVSRDGYIITNYHVISGADRIKATLYDKRTLKAEVVGADPKTDIAVLKISASGLPTIPWADSDSLKVGEFVLAIGNPFGLSHTVTMGIVSAVGRADVGIADYEDFIQTDAAINPGNSGGPLVDSGGNIIGINTAIFSKSGGYQGIGFAVPSNMARLIVEQLIKTGRVVRGWLGVTIQELSPELGTKFGYEGAEGALVGEVLDGSPAQKAGIKKGDIVLEYDGKKITSPAMLKNMAATSRPGSKAPIVVFRTQRQFRTMASIEEMPQDIVKSQSKEQADESRDVFSGLSVINLTDDISRQLGMKGTLRGVVVAGVQEGSPAFDAGIKRGDVITEIEGLQVQDYDGYMGVLSKLRTSGSVLIYINRGGRKFYATLYAS